MLPPLLLLLLLIAVPQARAADADFDRGLLWKIEKPGAAPSYVFGTLHASDPQVRTLPEPVAAAFHAARSLSVEITVGPYTTLALLEAMAAPPDAPLDRVLPPDLFRDVLRRAAEYGTRRTDLTRLKPWALMLLFGLPPSELRRQQAGEPALDVWLQQEAGAAGKMVYALETPAEQVDALEGLPLPVQLAMLKSVLRESDPELSFAVMRSLYVARDLAAIEAGWVDSLAQLGPADAARVRARFLDDRNRRMVQRMAPRLAEGNAFIAVGALHLPGDKGILNLLQAQGFAVTPVY
jgi:uncharacterized protein YbaP (TraB family)